MTHISVRTLGAGLIEIGARRVGPSAGRLFALLLYLACRRGQPTSRIALQELLFSQGEESHVAHSLRQLLYRLRQLGASVQTDADRVWLEGGLVTLDWCDDFNRQELGRSELERISEGLLSGYNPQITQPFGEWLDSQRGVISRALSRVLLTQLIALRRSGRWDLVDIAARALLALDPLSDEGTLFLAEALAAAGSKSSAMKVINAYLTEIGTQDIALRIAPTSLRRCISERLPDSMHRAEDDRLFVGREAAMKMLGTAGAAARSASQQIVLLWGEPGIGKSRALSEYRALFSLDGGLTAFVTCQSHDRYRPLGILCDLTTELLTAPGALGCDPEARLLLETLATANSQIGPRREEVAAEVPLPAIVRSLSDLVGAITTEFPLLVAIDDAQWIDQSSLRAIIASFSGAVGRRSFLLMASRDRSLLTGTEFHSDRISSLRLQPLAIEAARELTRHLLKYVEADTIDGIEQDLLRQARGNPFVIRLLCSHFIATQDVESLRDTVAEILERRMEQLSPEAVRVLEASVMLGKNCTLPRIESMLAIPRFRLLEVIEELDDRGLLQVSGENFLGPHALLSEVVMKRMATAVARALHVAAAEVLQRDCTLGQESLLWDCAEHWRLAENHLSAAAVLRECARHTMERGRPSDALDIFKRALDLTLPDVVRLQIVEQALSCVEQGINWNDATSLLAELSTLRVRTGAPPRIHDYFEAIEFGKDFHNGADLSAQRPKLNACLTDPGASAAHKLSAARQLLMIAEVTLDRESAIFARTQTLDIAPGTRSQLFFDVMYHTCFGDPDQGRVLAAELAEKSLQSASVLPHALNAGYALYRIGNSSDAERVLLRSLRIADASGAAAGKTHAYLLMARLCWSIGRYDESRSWYEKCDESSLTHASADLLWERSILGARLCHKEGRIEQARAHLQPIRQSSFAALALPAMHLLATEIQLRVDLGEAACSDRELERLLLLHVKGRGLGCHDEVMWALWLALSYHQRDGEAFALLREYVRCRRDGFSLDPRLHAALNEPRAVSNNVIDGVDGSMLSLINRA